MSIVSSIKAGCHYGTWYRPDAGYRKTCKSGDLSTKDLIYSKHSVKRIEFYHQPTTCSLQFTSIVRVQSSLLTFTQVSTHSRIKTKLKQHRKVVQTSGGFGGGGGGGVTPPLAASNVFLRT